MTPTSPSWAAVEKFLGVDGWRQVPAGERGGRRQIHISHDRSKKISPGRFGMILREQLEVSRADFWEAIRSGEPVSRPVEAEEAPVEHDAWG